MESSDDDTPLQVLAQSAGWDDTISGERGSLETFCNEARQSSCPATPLVMPASCSSRYEASKVSTGSIELPKPLRAVADKMQLLPSDAIDEANLNLCDKKTSTKKAKILEQRKANDIMTCFLRRHQIKAELPAQGCRVSSSASSGSGIKRTASGTAIEQSSQTP